MELDSFSFSLSFFFFQIQKFMKLQKFDLPKMPKRQVVDTYDIAKFKEHQKNKEFLEKLQIYLCSYTCKATIVCSGNNT